MYSIKPEAGSEMVLPLLIMIANDNLYHSVRPETNDS